MSTSTTGKIIGYLPGWNIPPSATALASAGYTHIIVAFGVFDLAIGGRIVPAFPEITAAYVKSLKDAGLKVLLSVGGASTSVANTTVEFNTALRAAPNQSTFESNFVSSFKQLASTYGFQGIDIDIEQGFNMPSDPQNAGSTFENPVGDVRIMANIIKRLRTDMPALLISLAPQTANVAPSQAFTETWASYSSLIMQTYTALSWVGIQLYNTGGMWGIDLNLYAPSVNNSNIATSPDFSVAMAVDLLESWPSQVNGQATGWLKYISYLKPEQVVLGYPVPDANGNSDGAPYAPTPVIKRAIQCLRTGVKGQYSCDTYVPPRTYPGIGGVFSWETSRDQNNNFAFARDLKNCVVNNNCTSTTPAPSQIKLGIKITNPSSTDFVLKPNEKIAITLNN